MSTTPYDTGSMLEPHPWIIHDPYAEEGSTTWQESQGRYGEVDFDNTEGGTEITVFAHPSTTTEGFILVQIDTALAENLIVMLNEGELYRGNVETEGSPLQELRALAKGALESGESDDEHDALVQIATSLGVEWEAW